MRITLDFTKSLEQNASHYFEQAKTAKKKAEGARKALEDSKKKLEKLEKEIEFKEAEETKRASKIERKKEWYEKFRWFYTSEDFLVIGGRDATTNEIVIKKHTDKEDIVFHTELSGSPFVVIKTEGKKPSKISLDEAAQFTACYSKAWKAGRSVADVFYVNPEQVTKEAKAGEFIARGAFMIYGKKNQMAVTLKLFIGKMADGKIMAGSETAVKKHCEKYVELIEGEDKNSNIAKKIKHKLEADDLDDILKLIPQGSKLKE
jgi:predicted ribosome quality control (RQC) complex YloA/Tae2 family protein